MNNLQYQDCQIGTLVTPQYTGQINYMDGQPMMAGTVYVITVYNLNWFQTNNWAFLLVK